MNNVISFSGGKDSTAMTLLMLERGEPIHSIVTFDTGWEFPQMYEHWEQFESYTGMKITVLKPERPFTYWMFEREVVARKGYKKGTVHRIGNGWPSPMRRWCTGKKIEEITRYLNAIESRVSCVGIAADEAHRVKVNSKYPCRYPLIEWDIDEAQALQICKDHGFNWGGLYDHFRRVSCFCCPLQRVGELKNLRKFYPELWQTMLQWDKCIQGNNRGFRMYYTVHDLEARFAEEDRHLRLPIHGCAVPRPECKTCNCQSAKLGCTWPVLHKSKCRHEHQGSWRIGEEWTESPFQPDQEEEIDV